MNKLQEFEQKNKERLDFLLNDYNPGHDETQMRYFIVGQGVTDYGKYKQAKAEIYSNYGSLQTSYFQLEKLKLEIQILEEEKQAVTEIRRRLKDVEIAEKRMTIKSLEKTIDRSLNELNVMFKLANEYYEKIKDRDVQELEAEFHIERLKKMVAMNTIYRGGNLSGVMDATTTLPEEMQQPILETFHSLQVTERRNQQHYFNEALATLPISPDTVATPTFPVQPPNEEV